MSDATQEKPNLPMFYRSPRPVDRARDAHMGLFRPSNYSFAAGTNAIPLLADELPMAAPYYPIVFADGPIPIPAAVVGLRNDQNLFVDASGQWARGAYIPAYVRRYPFILMDDTDQKQYVLCIDEESEQFREDGEFRLFEDGEPSAFTRSAMEFCAELRQQGEVTDRLVDAFKMHEILVPNDASIELSDGSRMQLSGFLVIDPKRFDALSDSVIFEWRARGWLGLVYAQLLSSHRWQGLVQLLRERGGEAEQEASPPAPWFPLQTSVQLPPQTEEFRLLRRPSKSGLIN
jgi:hypothetical protein